MGRDALPGLPAAPDTGGWVPARSAWMPLFAGLLVAIARFARPLESPSDGIGTARGAAAEPTPCAPPDAVAAQTGRLGWCP